MKHATDGGISLEYPGQKAGQGSILSDLVDLMTRLQTSIKFNEQAVATVGSDGEGVAGPVFVLDDVTPRYAMANVALNACHAAMGEALCGLLEAQISSVSPRAARAA
jgi:hypothetical protein